MSVDGSIMGHLLSLGLQCHDLRGIDSLLFLQLRHPFLCLELEVELTDLRLELLDLHLRIRRWWELLDPWVEGIRTVDPQCL